jgi:hypothetical protein
MQIRKPFRLGDLEKTLWDTLSVRSRRSEYSGSKANMITSLLCTMETEKAGTSRAAREYVNTTFIGSNS